MIKMRVLKTATSINLGGKEYTYIDDKKNVTINWDKENQIYQVICNKTGDSANVHYANVQFSKGDIRHETGVDVSGNESGSVSRRTRVKTQVAEE